VLFEPIIRAIKWVLDAGNCPDRVHVEVEIVFIVNVENGPPNT
jgi:hypothetical protein